MFKLSDKRVMGRTLFAYHHHRQWITVANISIRFLPPPYNAPYSTPYFPFTVDLLGHTGDGTYSLVIRRHSDPDISLS